MNGKEILSSLLILASTDNEISNPEEQFIKYVGLQLNISGEDIEDVKANYKTMSFSPPTSERERMTILYYLLFLIHSDKEINASEIQKVKEYGFRLGFDENLTHELIELLVQHLDEKLPPNAMLEKIRKYQN